MLKMLGDQISGWYRTHVSHNGLSNAFNWKGYKTLFHRSSHNYIAVYVEVKHWITFLKSWAITKCLKEKAAVNAILQL